MTSALQNHLAVIADMMKKYSSPAASNFMSIQEFVLKHGKHFEARNTTEDVPSDTPQQCFKNALELAWSSDEYTYCEGFISVHGVPLQHAWCINNKGKVVDPTIKRPGKDYEYFGVCFKTAFVTDHVFARKRYGIIDNPEKKFPLLRGKHEKEIIK